MKNQWKIPKTAAFENKWNHDMFMFQNFKTLFRAVPFSIVEELSITQKPEVHGEKWDIRIEWPFNELPAVNRVWYFKNHFTRF